MTEPVKTPSPIRVFALVFVGLTTLFVIGMIVWYTNILAGKDWCATAISVSRDAIPIIPPTATQACFSLLGQQVSALSIALFIFCGVVALCLASLNVIVVAGGHFKLKADKTGIDASVGGGPEPPPEVVAAKEVAGAAKDKADEIAEDAKP